MDESGRDVNIDPRALSDGAGIATAVGAPAVAPPRIR
jgi:hypothetical protein